MTAAGVNWGLSRISHKDPQDYSKPDDLTFIHQAYGTEITAYVVDSGINVNHENFAIKPIFEANFVDSNNTDTLGHGTFVAGVLAGKNTGVNSNVQIKAVKVFSGETTSSSVLMQGVAWAVNDYKNNTSPNKRAVLNLSLGGGAVDALDDLIKQAVAEGMFVAIAAGNSQENACDNSPGRVSKDLPGSVTAGAISQNDQIAVWPNNKGSAWGECVSGFAPGTDISSSMPNTDDTYGVGSGTSFAAPFVAGLATYFWSLPATKDYTPAQLETLIMNSNDNKLKGDLRGSPNKLAYISNGY